MKKLSRIFAITMIMTLMFSLALAGPSDVVAQSDGSSYMFVAELNGVSFDYGVQSPFSYAIQPCAYGSEQTSEVAAINICTTDLGTGHQDLGYIVFSVNDDMSVLKYPTWNTVLLDIIQRDELIYNYRNLSTQMISRIWHGNRVSEGWNHSFSS